MDIYNRVILRSVLQSHIVAYNTVLTVNLHKSYLIIANVDDNLNVFGAQYFDGARFVAHYVLLGAF